MSLLDDSHLPNAAQTDEGYSGCRPRALFMDLIKKFLALDKVRVAAKRNGRQRTWRSFWSFLTALINPHLDFYVAYLAYLVEQTR